MSIIYEALQKTQRNRQTKNDITDTLSRRIDVIDMALIVIIMALLITVLYLYQSHGNVRQRSSTVQKAVVQARSVQPVIQKSIQPVEQSVPQQQVAQQVIQSQPVQIAQAVAEPVVEQAEPSPPVVQVYESQPASSQPIEQDLSSIPETQTMDALSSPATTSAPTSAGLVLNGVLVSDDEKIALINNQSLHTGDSIAGMKVVSIEINKVILQQGSQFIVLRTAG